MGFFSACAVAAGALALASIAAPSGFCASLQVAPTTLRLDEGSGATVMYLTNSGTEPIIVQVEGFRWDKTGSADQLTPTDAIIVSPPMTRINPGQKQTVRLMVRPGGTPGIERTFRVLASELPDPTVPSAQAVRVLLQFNIPLFTNQRHLAPANLSWDATVHGKTISLAVRNSGGAHVKFSKLELIAANGRRIDVPSHSVAYVLAKGAHEWSFAAPGLRAGDRLKVEGRPEGSDHTIRADVVVRP